MRLLVLIAGLPLSGKTTIAKMLSEKLGAPVFSLGDVVREEAEKQRKDPGVIATELRVREGRRIIATRLAEKVKSTSSKIVIIEGVRSLEEVQELSEKLNAKTYLVYVVSSRPVRENRLRRRGRADDVTLVQLSVRDLREHAYGLTELLIYADKIVINDYESVEELEPVIVKLSEEIRRIAEQS